MKPTYFISPLKIIHTKRWCGSGQLLKGRRFADVLSSGYAEEAAEDTFMLGKKSEEEASMLLSGDYASEEASVIIRREFVGVWIWWSRGSISVSPLEEHHALKDVTLEVTEKIFPRGKGRVEHRMLLKDSMLILHLIWMYTSYLTPIFA